MNKSQNISNKDLKKIQNKISGINEDRIREEYSSCIKPNLISENILNYINIIHNILSVILLCIIILLLIDFYQENLTKHTKEMLLWIEIAMLSTMILVPSGLYLYRLYHKNQCIKKVVSKLKNEPLQNK